MPRKRPNSDPVVRVHFYTKRALRDVGLTWRDIPLYALQRTLTLFGPMHCAVERDGVIYHCGGKGGCKLSAPDRYPFAAQETFRTRLDGPINPADWILNRQFTLGMSVLSVLGLPVDQRRVVNCLTCSCRLLGMGPYRTMGQFRRAIIERSL